MNQRKKKKKKKKKSQRLRISQFNLHSIYVTPDLLCNFDDHHPTAKYPKEEIVSTVS
jgi:hypothetical protein